MKPITFRTIFSLAFPALLLSILNGCIKPATGTEEDGQALVAQFNLAGNWYNNQIDPGNTGYHNYLNISSTGTYYSIGVELWPSSSTTDTVQIYTSRFTIEKYLGKNLFLTHKNAGKGNGIDIDFTCTTPHARCTPHDDTLDEGGVKYLERSGTALRDAGVKTYLSDSSKITAGKFYGLRYLNGMWIKISPAFFSIKNGIRTDYESNGTVEDSASFTTTSSTFNYGGRTSQYTFIGDTLYVYGSSSGGYEKDILEYQPSTQSMPSQLFQ